MITKQNQHHPKSWVISRVFTLLLAVTVTGVYWTAPNEAALPHAATISVVAGGLHNPRGLNFGPDGALYVAEAASNSPAPGP